MSLGQERPWLGRDAQPSTSSPILADQASMLGDDENGLGEDLRDKQETGLQRDN